MAFIKAQKVVRDENGVITSGSAAIVDTVYVSTGSKNHSKHSVREKLGRVLYLSEDRKSGIFMSPTRGLVEYNALTDTFEGVERDDSRICSQGNGGAQQKREQEGKQKFSRDPDHKQQN